MIQPLHELVDSASVPPHDIMVYYYHRKNTFFFKSEKPGSKLRVTFNHGEVADNLKASLKLGNKCVILR